MKNKVNIAEILKNCPKGTKLYSPLCGECYFERLNQGTIICKKRNTQTITFTSDGYYMLPVFDDAEPMLFPSKENRDWDTFQVPFKDGVVVVNASNKNSNAFIYAGEDDDYYKSYVGLTISPNPKLLTDKSSVWVHKESGIRLASEEEKQILFDAIKANGYKWNAETKTLEKLIIPKFKVGDKIRHKTTNKNDIYEISEVYDDSYGLVDCTWMIYKKYQDQYELAPNKFDISTLKPFDKVLVRNISAGKWHIQLFEDYNKQSDPHYPFVCFGNVKYRQCIPYEGNEHLRGINNDCDEYFKTWK